MGIQDFIIFVKRQGFSHKEKQNDKCRFVISKAGFLDVEAFEIEGVTQIVYDPSGRYPAQISTKHWIK